MTLSLNHLLRYKAKDILSHSRHHTLSFSVLEDIFNTILIFDGNQPDGNTNFPPIYTRFSKIILNSSNNGYITEIYIVDIFEQLILLSKQK
jgi:hypothetical protein